MKLKTIAAVAAAGVALSGCATIIEGTTETISVTTTPVEGAKCSLMNSEGTWYLTTPGNATVHKTKNDIKAVCTKDGYQDATTIIPSHFNGATAGNVLAGGIIGIGIDAASGANYNYPQSSVVPMVPINAAPPASIPPPPAMAPPSGSPGS